MIEGSLKHKRDEKIISNQSEVPHLPLPSSDLSRPSKRKCIELQDKTVEATQDKEKEHSETESQISTKTCPSPKEIWMNFYLLLRKHGTRLNREAVSQILSKFDLIQDQSTLNFVLTPKEDSSQVSYDEVSLQILKFAQQLYFDEKNLLPTVYICLMLPIATLYPSDVSRQALNSFRQLVFKSRKDLPAEMPEEKKQVMAANVIIHAFRAHSYKKRKFIIENESKEKFIAQHSDYGLQLISPQPTQNPVQHDVAKQWLQAHPEGIMRDIATKIVKNIHHISFAKFLSHLKLTCEDINQKILSCPASERKYVILLPTKQKDKSNSWVTRLALDFLFGLPEAIICPDEAKEYFREHSDIKHVLYLDDGAFSGNQCSKILNYSQLTENFPNLIFHIGIPFMTISAARKIKSVNKNIELAYHSFLPNLSRIDFTQQETEQLEKMDSNSMRQTCFDEDRVPFNNLTLSYFDHKQPDELSTFEILFSGKLLTGKYSRLQLVPYIEPPYKSSEKHHRNLPS